MPRRIKIDQKKVSRNIRKLQKQISSGKVLQELNQLDTSPQKMPTPMRDLPTDNLVEKSPAGRKRRRNVSVKLASNMGYNSPQVIRRRTRSFKSPSRDAANTITRGPATTPLRAPAGEVTTSAVSSMVKEMKASDSSSRDITAVGQGSSSNDGDRADAPAKASSIETRRAARKKRLELMRQEAEAEKQRAAERGAACEDSGSDEDSDSTSSGDRSDSTSDSSSDDSSSEEASEDSSDSNGCSESD